jgi:hypothetical protein
LLTFIENSIAQPTGYRTIITGDFGTGKSISARFLTADLAREYLRTLGQAPKVIYLDLRGYDLKARTQEIIRFELQINCRMDPRDVDAIIRMYEQDEIHLICDSVDEMSKPFTKEGRKEVVRTLATIGNQAASVYFARSTYFESREEILKLFESLAACDPGRKCSTITLADICDLSEQQVDRFFESGIDNDSALAALRRLRRTIFKGALRDPLMVTLICEYINEHLNLASVEAHTDEFHDEKYFFNLFANSPTASRITFLNYLLQRILEREQKKRAKHSAYQYFRVFMEFLYEVAFVMVCQEMVGFPIEQWDAIVRSRFGTEEIKGFEDEAIDAFRTMALVHRDERTNTVAFRNELVALICAAWFVVDVIQRRPNDYQKLRVLHEWNNDCSGATTVTEYAGRLLEDHDIVALALMLEKTRNYNGRTLLLGILHNTMSGDRSKGRPFNLEEADVLGRLGNFIFKYPSSSLYLMPLIHEHTSAFRFVQWVFPVLVRLSLEYGRDNDKRFVDAAKLIIPYLHKWTIEVGENITHIGAHLKYFRDMRNQYFDRLLLNGMGLSERDVIKPENYRPIFFGLTGAFEIKTYERRYVDHSRTLLERDTNWGDI